MFCPEVSASKLAPSRLLKILSFSFAVALLCGCFGQTAHAQSLKREFDTADVVTLVVRNRDGRVSVIASEDQQKKVTVEATSPGLPVDVADVKAEAKGAHIDIEVRSRRPQDRIDIVVRIPPRSKVEIESEAGAVDVVGNVESALVKTDTGTIHGDVPLDA